MVRLQQRVFVRVGRKNRGMTNEAGPSEPSNASDDDLAQELIDSGGAFAGAAVGALVGSVAGPIGIVGGALAGTGVEFALVKIGAAVRRRGLEPREEMRAGTALAVASAQIKARLENGESLRDDEAFMQSENGKSPQAEQVLEGALRAAIESYEESKVPFIGELYASLVFRPDIGPAYAHSLIRTANRVSWRQMCLIAYLGRDLSDVIADLAREKPEREMEPPGAIWVEVEELSRLGLVGIEQEDKSVVGLDSVWGAAGGSRDLKPRLRLTQQGRDLFQLAGLQEIEVSEVDKIRASL